MQNKLKVTTQIKSGKRLMLAKVSLKSFIYDINDVFCFPNEKVPNLY